MHLQVSDNGTIIKFNRFVFIIKKTKYHHFCVVYSNCHNFIVAQTVLQLDRNMILRTPWG